MILFKKRQEIKYNLVHVAEGVYEIEYPNGRPEKIPKSTWKKIDKDLSFLKEIENIKGHSPEWIAKMQERTKQGKALIEAIGKLARVHVPFERLIGA
ncbi:MAG: hypothetical protein LBR41_01130 [Rickettsiales bacterium]|jgi:hypothetical protein|nr:hypothetical protein [Rickettsiales bacterium]